MNLSRCVLVFSVLCVVQQATLAQDQRIYRCGNEYTNTLPAGDRSRCKPLDGVEVTVVPAPPLPKTVAMNKPTQVSNERDNEARAILEAELRKARARRDELLAEYNQGEPEKMGSESRNHQKYLDRVASMKAAIDRVEQDISGISRELARHAGK